MYNILFFGGYRKCIKLSVPKVCLEFNNITYRSEYFSYRQTGYTQKIREMKELIKNFHLYNQLYFRQFEKCYQYAYQSICSFFFPDCELEKIPCGQMFLDLAAGCVKVLLTELRLVPAFLNSSQSETLNALYNAILINSRLSNCTMRLIDCGHPSSATIDNGHIIYNNTGLNATIKYKCEDGYKPLNNTYILALCDYNGKWKMHQVKCIPIHNMKTFKIILSVGLALAVIILVCIFVWKFYLEIEILLYDKFGIKLRRLNINHEELEEIYDAFVISAEDEETLDFIDEEMISQLEEKHKLKLCMPIRDFTLCQVMIDLITEKVQQSLSVVVLLNNHLHENVWSDFMMQEANFKKFANKDFRIILVPLINVKELNIQSRLIKAYMRTTTYISVAQPMFWTRLAHAIQVGSRRNRVI